MEREKQSNEIRPRYCRYKGMIHFLKYVVLIHSFILGSIISILVKILSN
ncbi:MAG: hypothetical protein ACLR9L_01875 [Lachnospirales bacterium]|nr:hypothetical protein [Eubacterium sp.]